MLVVTFNPTPEQYYEMLEALRNHPEITLTQHADTSIGHLHTSKADMDFSYNAGIHELKIENIKGHGLAKFASETEIKEHLAELLDELELEGAKYSPEPKNENPNNPPPQAVQVSQNESQVNSGTQVVPAQDVNKRPGLANPVVTTNQPTADNQGENNGGTGSN